MNFKEISFRSLTVCLYLSILGNLSSYSLWAESDTNHILRSSSLSWRILSHQTCHLPSPIFMMNNRNFDWFSCFFENIYGSFGFFSFSDFLMKVIHCRYFFCWESLRKYVGAGSSALAFLFFLWSLESFRGLHHLEANLVFHQWIFLIFFLFVLLIFMIYEVGPRLSFFKYFERTVGWILFEFIVSFFLKPNQEAACYCELRILE